MTTLDGRGDDRRTTWNGSTRRLSRVSLYWRVFAVNAAILSVAVLLLIVTPIAIDPQPTRGQLVVLAAGLLVMLVANAWLVRFSLRPLRRLSELMSDRRRPRAREAPRPDRHRRGRGGDLDVQLDARPARERAAGEHAPGAGRPGGRAAPDRAGAARPDRAEPHRRRPRAEAGARPHRLRRGGGAGRRPGAGARVARGGAPDQLRAARRPPSTTSGLASALASLCSGIERRAGITVGLDGRGRPPPARRPGRAGGLPRSRRRR